MLHRSFGIPKVDAFLKQLASQIPESAEYSISLNLEKNQITLRSNIPFTSLAAWLGMEFMGKGPAGLKLPTGRGDERVSLNPIGSARASARRAHHKNNLKMIGPATHNYHDVFGSFPPSRDMPEDFFDVEVVEDDF